MGIFGRRRGNVGKGGSGGGTIPVSPTLGHPGVGAFVDDIAGHRFEAASHRYAAITSWEQRIFTVTCASNPAFLDPGAPAIPERIQRWTQERPDDAVAWTMAGAFGVTAGWAARGRERAVDVPEDAWPAFHQLLAQGEEALDRSIKLDPLDPTPWVPTLHTGRGLGIGPDGLRQRFDEITRRGATDLVSHRALLQGLCAKWGGSQDEVFAFARGASADAPDGSPLHSLLVDAHLEQVAETGGSVRAYLSGAPRPELEAAADRSVAHPDFRDDAEHPTGVLARNAFAFGLGLAGATGRSHQEAVRLGTRLDEWPWRYLGDPSERLDDVLRAGPWQA